MGYLFSDAYFDMNNDGKVYYESDGNIMARLPNAKIIKTDNSDYIKEANK